MKKIIFLICFDTILIGQILPTIPRNVFRISLGSKVEDSQWDIKNNLFFILLIFIKLIVIFYFNCLRAVNYC